MVSRKKKKGQDRKAKAASSGSSSRGVDVVSNQMRSLDLGPPTITLPDGSRQTIHCYHGAVGSPPLPGEHPIHQFMKDFDYNVLDAINESKDGPAVAVAHTCKIVTDVDCWQGLDSRKRLVTHLVSVGAEWRLAGNNYQSAVCAICILYMQFLVDVDMGRFSISDIEKSICRVCSFQVGT